MDMHFISHILNYSGYYWEGNQAAYDIMEQFADAIFDSLVETEAEAGETDEIQEYATSFLQEFGRFAARKLVLFHRIGQQAGDEEDSGAGQLGEEGVAVVPSIKDVSDPSLDHLAENVSFVAGSGGNNQLIWDQPQVEQKVDFQAILGPFVPSPGHRGTATDEGAIQNLDLVEGGQQSQGRFRTTASFREQAMEDVAEDSKGAMLVGSRDIRIVHPTGFHHLLQPLILTQGFSQLTQRPQIGELEVYLAQDMEASEKLAVSLVTIKSLRGLGNQPFNWRYEFVKGAFAWCFGVHSSLLVSLRLERITQKPSIVQCRN
jgi:hypothetical protein